MGPCGQSFTTTSTFLLRKDVIYGHIWMVPDVEHGLVVVAAGAEALVAVGPVLHQDLRATHEMLLGLL